MKKMPLLFVLALGCAPSKPPCTAASLDALKAIYSRAAREVIDSGACDAVEKVEECPEYRMVELHYYAVGSALCGSEGK